MLAIPISLLSITPLLRAHRSNVGHGGPTTFKSNVQQKHNERPSGAHAESHIQSDDLLGEIGGRPDVAGATPPEFQPPAAVYEGRSAASESRTLLRALWHSGHRLRVVLLGAGIAVVLIGNMVGQIRLNTWNGSFFDFAGAAQPFQPAARAVDFFRHRRRALGACGRTDLDAADAQGPPARMADPSFAG